MAMPGEIKVRDKSASNGRVSDCTKRLMIEYISIRCDYARQRDLYLRDT